MPPAWRNYGVGAGVGAVGESDPLLAGDATLGTEYRFTIAAGASETIHIRRYYGTTTIPCFISAKCGNGALDPGELCDTTDTTDCNGNTCSASVCGDDYINTTAGETCESGGLDTTMCNGALCTAPACGDGYTNQIAGEACDDGGDSIACNADCTPAMCGDGYANAMAGEACDDAGDSSACNVDCTPAMCGDGYVNAVAEQCEGGELCDPATCTVTFTLGGGCAGCGAGGDAGGPLLLGVALAIGRRRRRRRARAA
jgi:MYXO-CTERM domain-containing protein